MVPPPRVGQGWKSDELLYQHFWNENNSPGMLHKTHREQQQKTYLRFLTEKGDLFINNSWVPIEHAWQKQCYSIENTVICHCFIWHLHFFFFSWYCKTFLDGMQKLYKWKKIPMWGLFISSVMGSLTIIHHVCSCNSMALSHTFISRQAS